MTKAKLERLISLSVDYWVQRYQQEGVVQFDANQELAALQAEFAAWEPEAASPRRPDPMAGLRFADPGTREAGGASVETPQHYEPWKQIRDERDEARQIARELLEDADADDWDEHRMRQRYPWLKDKDS